MTEERTFTIRLADKRIRIVPMYETIREYCKEYITDESDAVDFIVKTGVGDIEFEREYSDREAVREGKEAVCYPDDYLETLAVYRQIAEWMPFQDTLLFHGSAVAVDGRAYLFTAKSGTGKSTHTRLWREYFGERAVMVNDDKPLLRVRDDSVFVCGTPWNGKHRLSTNIEVPLTSICILTRAEENSIQRITPSEAYPMLLQQSYRPADTKALAQTLMVLERLQEKVAFYRLGCNMSMKAAEVAYNGMKE